MPTKDTADAGRVEETVNDALERMRELAINPQKRAEMEAAWGRILDHLEQFYLAMRPKPRSFEVHHMNEIARYRFACAIAANRPLDDCVAVAVEKITGRAALSSSCAEVGE